jgi:uncharacterized cupredoxin-like copper-binding protein
MTKTTKRSTLLLASLVILSTVLAACGSSGGSSGATTVQITLTDFGVQSSLTTFSVGVPYHFVIANKGAVAHQLLIMSPTGDPKQALLTVGENDLQAGASKAVDYTFTAAAPAGTLEFACHITGHYEAGMHLPIVVK